MTARGSVTAGFSGVSSSWGVFVAAGCRLPDLALDFLFDHVANLNFDFLLFDFVSGDSDGAGFFNGHHFADVHLASAGFRLADGHVALFHNFFFNLFRHLHLAGASFRLADGHCVLAGDCFLHVFGVVYLASASFRPADGDGVFFLDFFCDVLCDAHFASASLGLADGDIPGVLLFFGLALVYAVFHFGFDEFGDPHAAGAGGLAAGAAGNFHGAFFPVSLILAHFTRFLYGDHLTDRASSHTLFLSGNQYCEGFFLFFHNRLADGAGDFAFFRGRNHDGVSFFNFLRDGFADGFCAFAFFLNGDHDFVGPFHFANDRFADFAANFAFFGDRNHHGIALLNLFRDAFVDGASDLTMFDHGGANFDDSLFCFHFRHADFVHDGFPCSVAGSGNGCTAGVAGS